MIDFFISGAIWAYFIINYSQEVFAKIQEYLSFLGGGIMQMYASYLVFVFLSALVGLGVSYIIYLVFDGHN